MAILISQKIPFEYLSEVSDKEGRYIMVSRKIDGVVITLYNTYAPRGSDFAFYRNMFDLMIAASGIVICGGDWNIRLNLKLDSSKNSTTTSLHRKINILMTKLGILDLWRDFHPSSRDYIFYSCPHTYSRIDNFFCV